MPTGEGAICLPLENLRTLLANLTEFQSWTGTGTVSAAKDRTYLFGVDRKSILLPVAVVTWDEQAQSTWEKHADGAANLWTQMGSAFVHFYDKISEGAWGNNK